MQQVKHHVRREFSLGLDGLAHGGEVVQLRHGMVVDTDDGHALGDRDVRSLQGPKSDQCDLVRVREYPSGRLSQGQELFGSLGGTLVGVGDRDFVPAVQIQARIVQSRAIALGVLHRWPARSPVDPPF